MFRPTLTASIAALVIATASAGAVSAQQMSAAAPASLTCGDIANLEAAHAAALVYYVAGWTDAESSSTGAGAMAPGDDAGAADDQMTADEMTADQTVDQTSADEATAAGGSQAVGGLTLSAAAVIQMCLTQPDSTIAEIIDAQGGSGVLGATGAPASAGTGAEPADDAAPAGGTDPVETAPMDTAPADPATEPTTPTEPMPADPEPTGDDTTTTAP